jgi:phenylalanyl-tRNA synthetase beta subunit
LHRLKDFKAQEPQVNLATHLFARICEGNCKKTRTKYSVSKKLADLMRISSHLFFTPKQSHLHDF